MTTSIEYLYACYLGSAGVSIDTRTMPKGCLFFAIRGDRFDGNRFALQALQGGAAYAVVDDPALAGHDRCLLVGDTLRALQDLARHVRRQYGVKVLAITGSNGKTTTKELCHAVLSEAYRVHATPGNFNNHIGVPLTLLSMPAVTEVAVVEMGDNRRGDVAELCRIAEPDYGIITNVGKDHLEGFGSFEGNVRAKAELFEYLAEQGGVALVSSQDPIVSGLAKELLRGGEGAGPKHPQVVWYGAPGDAHCLRLTAEWPFLAYADEAGREVGTQLFGRYNFYNVQAAHCVGREFAVPEAAISRGIAGYVPLNNRSQVLRRGGHTIVLDAYNANPSSMQAALESFAAWPAGLPKVAVLGDMLELGGISEEEHAAMAAYAQGLPLEAWCCGAHFRRAVPDAPEDPLALLPRLRALPPSAILLKGSRGMRLERLLDAFGEQG
jgi:UDP-N-acetylmuramoyl-tripeptide--D-alanyl-D-alanine ligase